MRQRLLAIGVAVAILGTGALVSAGRVAASAADATHRIAPGTMMNYSAAVESPTLSFTCDTRTGVWTFGMSNVQVMDSRAHPWIGEQGTHGPWQVHMFTNAGVIFNAAATLQQNRTNGLFYAKSKGTAPDVASWCQTGVVITAFAFSGGARDEQSLLLDATLT